MNDLVLFRADYTEPDLSSLFFCDDGRPIFKDYGMFALHYTESKFENFNYNTKLNIIDFEHLDLYIYYWSSATGGITYLGQSNIAPIIPSVYPDHGQNKLGDSFLINFTLVFNRAHANQYTELENYTMHDEYIAFAFDCDDVQPYDVKLRRLKSGEFEHLDTAKFTSPGSYDICWKPPNIQYNGYIIASDSQWIVTHSYGMVQDNPIFFKLNSKYEHLFVEGHFSPTDKFQLFTGQEDCHLENKIGNENFCRVFSPST